MIKKILLYFVITLTISAQYETPLEKSNYLKLTSYEDLISYITEMPNNSEYFKIKYPFESVQKRKIPLVLISKDDFMEVNKLCVMLFAQQHGNEPSGKEGLLLLLKSFASSELDFLLDSLNILILPQINPDGSEIDDRRNANDKDLNRDHFILSQPETKGLHKVFNEYLPHATLDIHEYSPFSKDWLEFGYIKTFDEQFGIPTNLNVSSEIRKDAKENLLPFLAEKIINKGYTFHEYIVGGPPSKERIRFSTTDINDGRQSFAIQNSYSFILEGKNGKTSSDNIERRAKAQMETVKSFLNYLHMNKSRIKNMIDTQRNFLTKNSNDKISLRMEHFKEQEKTALELFSLNDSKNTILLIDEFHSIVKSHLDRTAPKGYLVKKNDNKIKEFLDSHNIDYSDNKDNKYKILEYHITEVKKKTEEELENIIPFVELNELTNVDQDDFYFIPVEQLKKNVIMLAFEPESMFGFFQSDEFKYLFDQQSSRFGILRLE